MAWRDGKATVATIRRVGGTTTELRAGAVRRPITLRPGKSVTVRIP